MTDYKKMIAEHSCKPNQGCGVMTICMCGVAEDMADEIERLRKELEDTVKDFVRLEEDHAQLYKRKKMQEADAEEIEQLREALSAMTELFKATEASAQWALSEVERLHHALECVVLYWDEWKDAPDDHPTALSLEEVVNICRPHLKEKE